MPLVIEETDTYSFDYYYRRLAVESAIPENILSLFRKVIPKSSELLCSYLPGLQAYEQGNPEIFVKNSDTKRLLSEVRKLSYMSFQDTLITVPEGFTGSLNAYLEALLLDQSHLFEKTFEYLRKYSVELSMFLSNQEKRISLTSHNELFREIRSYRERTLKEMQRFVDKKNATRSRARLGDVFERFADFERFFALSEKLADQRKRQDFKKIVSEVQKASELLKLIKDRVDAGEFQDISGQRAKDVAEGAYEAARCVELVSLYAYFVESALATSKNLVTQFTALTAQNA